MSKCIGVSHIGAGLDIHAYSSYKTLTLHLGHFLPPSKKPNPAQVNNDPRPNHQDGVGEIYYDVNIPKIWNIEDTNLYPSLIRDWMNKNEVHTVDVPFVSNRVVIAPANVFRESDKWAFSPGYKNRKMQITYIFGLSKEDTGCEV